MFMQPWTDFVQTFSPSQVPTEAAEGGENVCMFGGFGTRSRRNFYSIHSTKYAPDFKDVCVFVGWQFSSMCFSRKQVETQQ